MIAVRDAAEMFFSKSKKKKKRSSTLEWKLSGHERYFKVIQ